MCITSNKLVIYRVGFNGNDETEVDAMCEDEAIELAKMVATESGLGFELDYVESYGHVEDGGSVVCLTDITGTIGAWLDAEIDNEVPNEVISLLYKAYAIATKELDNSNKSKWTEIRNDFVCEDSRKIYIDAWSTDDDNEEGNVIARIDMDTKNIEYFDDEAKTDEYAQEVINEALSEINKEI